MRIIISEFMDDAAVAALAAQFEVVHDATLVDRRSDLLAALVDADALIVRNRTQVDAALLAAGTRLRVVGRLGVGLDNIDSAACAARGVVVIPATGANALAVAEYVMATAMLLLRGVYAASATVGAGQWPRAAMSDGREIAGKTLGLVGFGGIGRLVSKLGRGLGMRVIAFDPQIPAESPLWRENGALCVTLDAAIEAADVLSLHVPLVPETRNLIDATRLARMKGDAILINTARGGIVDEAALASALRAGRLAGAALDVYAAEPLPAGSPLADCPNLLLTPHVAGVTRESNVRVSTMIADAVAAALRAPEASR